MAFLSAFGLVFQSMHNGCMMLRSVFIGLVSLIALAALSGQLHARPLDEVVDSGYLTVFVYQDYAPYSWERDGELVGLDVDIARIMGEKLGVEIRFLVRGADENVDDDLRINIWKGDLIHRRVADVMMHVPYDPELDSRNELVVLFAPYFREEMGIAVNNAELPEVNTFGRFVTNPIAVELDTAGDFFLSNAFRGQLHPSVRRGRTFADVVKLFNDREAPAAMGSLAQVEWLVFQAPFEARTEQPPMPGIVRRFWPIGIAVKHDSRDLGYFLTDVVDELAATGQLTELAARYGVSWKPAEQ